MKKVIASALLALGGIAMMSSASADTFVSGKHTVEINTATHQGAGTIKIWNQPNATSGKPDLVMKGDWLDDPDCMYFYAANDSVSLTFSDMKGCFGKPAPKGISARLTFNRNGRTSEEWMKRQ